MKINKKKCKRNLSQQTNKIRKPHSLVVGVYCTKKIKRTAANCHYNEGVLN